MRLSLSPEGIARTGLITLCTLVFLFSASASASPLKGAGPVADEMVYDVDPAEPVTLLLSRSRYSAEDGHLDAIVWLGGAVERPGGRLELEMRDARGRRVSSEVLSPVPGARVFFSYQIPASLHGSEGEFEVVWREGGRERGSAKGVFRVAEPEGAPEAGRIRITVPNERGVSGVGIPVTLGVPFPRGALASDEHTRLVDSEGEEVSLQRKVTARWSRFGSIKWLQCDFTAHMDGGMAEYHLEYGPGVSQEGIYYMRVEERPGRAPLVEAGPVRFGDGIEYDPGDGRGFRKVVSEEGLSGAYVAHEDGMVYAQAEDVEWEVEEEGPEKVVLRRKGWYTDPGTGARFCRFNTRFVIHRGSPFVGMYHTWIYTGDASEDRIRSMGWRFGLDEGMSPEGFYIEDGKWEEGDYLLQYDFEHYEIVEGGELSYQGGRALGIAAARGNGVRVAAGVRDFWQNYPNELEFLDGAFYVHQWPRHGRPSVHPVRIEDGLRLWFAHEGELLDFALPVEWTEDPDFYYASPPRNRRPYQLRHSGETINAQGIAKTDEVWLLFAPEWVGADVQAEALGGMNDNTLRAFAEPEWVAGSGAFYEIHHQDWEKYPEHEHYFELAALAPMEWVERIRFYGKWIWGDMTWQYDLDGRAFGLYRGFRKAHHGWPYSWIPYARSGDMRLRMFAEAATRHMTDVAFCHYSDSRVPGRRASPTGGRSRGFTVRYRVPWAWHGVNPSSRGYVDKAEFMLHSYYLAGYRRAKDVFTDWAWLTKHEGWNNWAGRFDDRSNFHAILEGHDTQRGSVNLLKSYVQTYEATFDPWFLAAAHQIAGAHLHAFREEGWEGHHWQSGPREFHRFTGCDEYREFYLAYAEHQGGRVPSGRSETMAEPAAYAYLITGDEYWLRRVRRLMDWDTMLFYDGEPDYFKGVPVRSSGPATTTHSYWLQYYPFLPAALERAGYSPPPLPMGFYQLPGPSDAERAEPVNGRRAYLYTYRILFLKEAGKPVPFMFLFQDTGLRGWRWRVEDAEGESVLRGEVNTRSRHAAELPAGEPAGLYRLVVEGESSRPQTSPGRNLDALFLPVTPHDVPALWELGEDREIGATSRFHEAQYWFYVPEGMEEFGVDFLDAGRWGLNKITVWDPDDGVAWRFEGRGGDPSTMRAEITVGPGHSGKLWRVTIPGRSYGMRLDGRLPRYISMDPESWFDPEDSG